MSLLRASLTSVLSYYTGKHGTYCSVVPDLRTAEYLNRLSSTTEKLCFKNTSSLNHHVTVAHSSNTVSKSQHHDLWSEGFHSSTNFHSSPMGLTHWAGHDGEGYVVLKLDSPDLSSFNKHLVDKYGLSGDFAEYNPHVTIASDVYGKGMYAEDLIQQLNEIKKPERLSFSGLRFEDTKV